MSSRGRPPKLEEKTKRGMSTRISYQNKCSTTSCHTPIQKTFLDIVLVGILRIQRIKLTLLPLKGSRGAPWPKSAFQLSESKRNKKISLLPVESGILSTSSSEDNRISVAKFVNAPFVIFIRLETMELMEDCLVDWDGHHRTKSRNTTSRSYAIYVLARTNKD